MTQLLKLTRCCKHCGSDMTDAVSSIAYSQNPFCNQCHNERAENAARNAGPSNVELVGRYFHFTQEQRKAG